MEINEKLINDFEKGLDPRHIENSAISASIAGYGEISAIFQINEDKASVYKRLPIFEDASSARNYEKIYHEYNKLLTKPGLKLPQHNTAVVSVTGRPVSLYIVQEKFPAEKFCHNLIHTLDSKSGIALIEKVIAEISKVWEFNKESRETIELAIDGQLSNWVSMEKNIKEELIYVDTSTPLYRKNSIEQLDPELLLKSTPGFLRWIIRLFFLQDIMNRYYVPRQVFTDIAANLYKEQKPELVTPTIDIINRYLPDNEPSLTLEEVKKYYKEDKLTWSVYLIFRKVNRFIISKILRRRYEFILPGHIKR